MSDAVATRQVPEHKKSSPVRAKWGLAPYPSDRTNIAIVERPDMLKYWWQRTRAFLRTQIFRNLLGVVLFFSLYSILVNTVESELLDEELNFAASVTAFLSVALSLLMVFRTNGAYDRWWDIFWSFLGDCRIIG